MIRAADIPNEVLIAFIRRLAETDSNAEAIAAAINAWDGIALRTEILYAPPWTEDSIVLPLKKDTNSDQT